MERYNSTTGPEKEIPVRTPALNRIPVEDEVLVPVVEWQAVPLLSL
jgi:hypothetical protein